MTTHALALSTHRALTTDLNDPETWPIGWGEPEGPC